MTIPPKKKGRIQNFAAVFVIFLVFFFVIGGAFALYFFKGKAINTSDIRSAEKILGLTFSPKERRMLLGDTRRNLLSYATIREMDIPNSVPPALQFNPVVGPKEQPVEEAAVPFSPDLNMTLPENRESIAFFSVRQLASLLRTGQITSMELTELYLKRLKKYGPALECVVTLTEDLARKQARRADEEMAAGRYRGPLHGIPWGVKDLLSTRGYPTTWGAMPYKDQILDEDATVVQRLEEAGAVLVAKLSLGALAMGDYWYGGRTRSPWNLNRGSSGSSAGPGAATAAGLVGFSIGTETHGSIISPSTRNAVTGLRPTYGRVSRHGAMALSWSMDKIGPMCRTAEGCAYVFDAIYGPDGKDLTLLDMPFVWNPERELKDLRIGYYKKSFDGNFRDKEKAEAVLDYFREIGVDLVPVELPDMPINSISFILDAEAAAAFDELTRSGRDDLLVRQTAYSWPNTFRIARFIPAVEYIQANRARTLYMIKLTEALKNIDVYISTNRAGNLLATNLTGHPAVCVPTSMPTEEGDTTAITFIGHLFREADALLAAKIWQDGTGFFLASPDLEKTLSKKIKGKE